MNNNSGSNPDKVVAIILCIIILGYLVMEFFGYDDALNQGNSQQSVSSQEVGTSYLVNLNSRDMIMGDPSWSVPLKGVHHVLGY